MGSMAPGGEGLSMLLRESSDSDNEERMKKFQEHILERFLAQTSGTLLIVLGVKNEPLASILTQFDEATGVQVTDKDRQNRSGARGDDLIELLTYIRFCTPFGSPMHKQRLIDGGFNRSQIGEAFPGICNVLC